MQFLNLDGLTAGKEQRVLTDASHGAVMTAKEKGVHWEIATRGCFQGKKKEEKGHGCGTKMPRSWPIHTRAHASCARLAS